MPSHPKPGGARRAKSSSAKKKDRPQTAGRKRPRKKKAAQGSSAKSDDPRPRLQKVLAAAGLGSRRQCEELIVAGRVEIDRQTVTELGVRVDPSKQAIRVDGESLPRPKRVVLAVHKPKGVVTTNRDPAGRPRVIDLLPLDFGRLFPIGRLDLSSEGLILVTNDGDLANELTHPRYGVQKTYHVEVAGEPQGRDLARLERGVHLSEGLARAVSVRIKKKRPHSTLLEMVLDEGRNREIRRLFASIGHKVQRLVRVAVGTVRLGEMPAGAFRPLTSKELRDLRGSVGHQEKRQTPPKDQQHKLPKQDASEGARSGKKGRSRQGAKTTGARPGAKGSRPPRPGKGKGPIAGRGKPKRPGRGKRK